MSPHKVTYMQSVLKLEVVPTEKSFKKGYLVYEPGADELWKRVKEAVSK